MIIYFAAVDPVTLKDAIVENTDYILCSYHYFNNQTSVVAIKDIQKEFPKKTLFTDSGAFSAYSSGKKINLSNYCLYLKSIRPTIYAGLDVIGDPVKTIENQKYMEGEFGLNPIPTFHVGEELKHLERLLKDYDYIALGGMVMAGNLKSFLDKVWQVILQSKPELKVHGFGMTSQKNIERYPWYSIDSTSYDRATRFGIVTLADSECNLYTKSTSNWKKEFTDAGGDERVYTHIKVLREEAIKVGIEAFKRCVAKISKNHETRDFSYLTNTWELFD